MENIIENLLILQDRDRRIIRLKDELSHIGPERSMLTARAKNSQQVLDEAKKKANQIESRRKDLELQVEQKKAQIDKYAIQQFQTKKNEEFRALGREIERAKTEIIALEDQQIELMEEAELAAVEIKRASAEAADLKKLAEDQISDLNDREVSLENELKELESHRGDLAAGVDATVLPKYERLLEKKGGSVLVGINHGVCGGCHMQLPIQIKISCKNALELVQCPNCGRILYYTRDMDME